MGSGYKQCRALIYSLSASMPMQAGAEAVFAISSDA